MDAFDEWRCGWPSSSVLISSSDSPSRIEYGTLSEREAGIVSKLRHPSRSNLLRDYLD